MKHFPFWIAAVIVILANSCTTDKSNKIPDVSDVKIDWSLVRYEAEMLGLDSANGTVYAEPLFTKYPVFSQLYFRNIMGFNVSNDSLPAAAGELIGHHLFRHWLDTCHQVFLDFTPYEKELKRSFQLLRYYFPEREVPRVYSLVSEFSIGNFIFIDADGRDALGIGLDFFLGPEFPYVAMAGEFPAFSRYLSRSFTPDHLTRKTMAVIVDDLTGDIPPSNLLESMLHEGKKMYILEKLIPFANDTVLWEFTPEQWAWVTNNEGEIWRHFVEDDLLYSNDRTLIQKLTLASPNSPGMPLEAPGRTAVFTGYKIISAFHRRNPDLSLRELINENDPQKILNASKYKPR